MRLTFAVLLFLVMFFFSTCTKDVYNPDLCFNDKVLPIFVTHCTMNGCHNSTSRRGRINLTSYEGIMRGITAKHPLESSIYNKITGISPSMPPSNYPKLSSEEVSLIRMWIGMGAQNSTSCNQCDTINFTYSNRISSLMQTWCVGCHNTNSNGGGIILTDYAGVSAVAANNRLLGSLKHLPGFSAMPKNGGQLQSCDITAIEKWVNAGYPNN